MNNIQNSGQKNNTTNSNTSQSNNTNSQGRNIQRRTTNLPRNNYTKVSINSINQPTKEKSLTIRESSSNNTNEKHRTELPNIFGKKKGDEIYEKYKNSFNELTLNDIVNRELNATDSNELVGVASEVRYIPTENNNTPRTNQTFSIQSFLGEEHELSNPENLQQFREKILFQFKNRLNHNECLTQLLKKIQQPPKQ